MNNDHTLREIYRHIGKTTHIHIYIYRTNIPCIISASVPIHSPRNVCFSLDGRYVLIVYRSETKIPVVNLQWITPTGEYQWRKHDSTGIRHPLVTMQSGTNINCKKKFLFFSSGIQHFWRSKKGRKKCCPPHLSSSASRSLTVLLASSNCPRSVSVCPLRSRRSSLKADTVEANSRSSCRTKTLFERKEKKTGGRGVGESVIGLYVGYLLLLPFTCISHGQETQPKSLNCGTAIKACDEI